MSKSCNTVLITCDSVLRRVELCDVGSSFLEFCPVFGLVDCTGDGGVGALLSVAFEAFPDLLGEGKSLLWVVRFSS